MPGNPLVRFDEGRVGRTARCRLLSYSTVRVFFEPIDDAENAVLDERHLEVDEQAKAFVGEPKVCQKLLLVNRGEEFDGLHFYDYFIFHDQIGPESGVDADILIDHWHRLLPHCAETPAVQFVGQNRVVNRFQ